MGGHLIAKVPILFRCRQYNPGDELPVSDAVMVDAWISAGSAVWADPDEEPQPAKKATKARRAAAEPGIEGKSDSGPVLQGKIPETPERAAGKKKGAK